MLGFAMALAAAFFLGQLPVLMRPAAAAVDPWTLNWFRLALPAACFLGTAAWRGTLHHVGGLWRVHPWMAVLMVAGLASNFVLYVIGLRLAPEVVCQTTFQLAPMLFALAALYVFGERFTLWQWVGCIVLVAGYVLFLGGRLATLPAGGTLVTGVLLIGASAGCWVVYALAQKRALDRFPPLAIATSVFAGCALVLTPFASFSALAGINGGQRLLLMGAAAATLIGQYLFTAALEVWAASRVSATLTLIPVFTMLAVAVGSSAFPRIVSPSNLPATSVFGAMLVVAGAALTSLAGKSPDHAGRSQEP